MLGARLAYTSSDRTIQPWSSWSRPPCWILAGEVGVCSCFDEQFGRMVVEMAGLKDLSSSSGGDVGL